MTSNLNSRLKKHNSLLVPYSKKFAPWKIKNAIWFSNKTKAFAFEKYLKSASGRAFCKKHL
ncbi:MAG: GIY-YIG nuclease family protein [Deltaproteobacteria bacterium]|nr:GIY-YIG nuclease family protein [Deltaproteobacteria bacterium]